MKGEQYKVQKGTGYSFTLSVGQMKNGRWTFGVTGKYKTPAETGGIRWPLLEGEPGFHTRTSAEAAGVAFVKGEILRLEILNQRVARQLEMF